jgi:fatty acid desaturase
LRENRRATRVDQLVLGLHVLLWFGLPVYLLGWADATINYLLMTWFIGPYLGAVFLVNHIGTHVVFPGERMPGFIQKLITTRNLGDSKLEDMFFGGINNHIEHHLFPSIPTYRLHKARRIVRKFCQQHGLPYQEMKWGKAAGKVFSYLNQISRQPA